MTSHRLQRVGPCRNECSANANANAIGLSSNRLLCCWVNCMHACMHACAWRAAWVACHSLCLYCTCVTVAAVVVVPSMASMYVYCRHMSSLDSTRSTLLCLDLGEWCVFWLEISFVAAVHGACDPSIDLTAVTTGSRDAGVRPYVVCKPQSCMLLYLQHQLAGAGRFSCFLPNHCRHDACMTSAPRPSLHVHGVVRSDT